VAPALPVLGLTLLALIAFASNSILTRLALGAGEIDAATFTAIRLGSGAAVLALCVRAQARSWAPLRGRPGIGPVALFAYAAPFSFAYLRIDAATGAFVLFGVVQLTMIGWALGRGERPGILTWAGILVAIAGLALFTLPSANRADPLGLALMAIAGIAWGVYSLAGRKSGDPIVANARSFLWSSPVAVLLALLLHASAKASGRGVGLALVSGAITSGLGYACWYRVLPRLSVMQAAVAQLAVPVFAAAAAVALLGERPGARLAVSGLAILGGVGLVLFQRARVAAS
jgi:drug/metabolite transporter (DMT)-like permease